jgi:hypothetical protein
MKFWTAALVMLFVISGLPTVTAQQAESPRLWKDSSGQFSIQAKYSSFSEGNVVLLDEGNREVTIPLKSLSLADQQYVMNPSVPNNLKCVDLSDMQGQLPLIADRTKQILRRSEPWEFSTWKPEARKDDTVGYPSVARMQMAGITFIFPIMIPPVVLPVRSRTKLTGRTEN